MQSGGSSGRDAFHWASWRQASRTTQRAEVDDQPALLGQRHEVARRHEADARPLPAHERLDAVDRAAGHADDGLVVEHELLALHGAPQGGLGAHPLERAGPQRRVEHLVARATARLGAVHRRVGVAQQVDGRLRLRAGQRDADRGGDEDLLLGQPEGPAQRRGQALGDDQGAVLVADVLAQHDELVAAERADGVLRAHGLAQALADGHQQLVAARRGRASR